MFPRQQESIKLYSANGKKEKAPQKQINVKKLLITSGYRLSTLILESKELRLLFDAARDAEPEDLKAVHNMLLALKRKEQHYDD